jgi:alpha-tubulin suppressor-like RCC1 family protein
MVIFFNSLEKGDIFTVGDNNHGQLGNHELFPIHSPIKVNLTEDLRFKKVSAGFQHSLFLSDKGEVYGCGKSDKYQLGEDYLKKFHKIKGLKDVGLGIIKINFDVKEKIIDLCAGKYHSIFLTGKTKINQKREMCIV